MPCIQEKSKVVKMKIMENDAKGIVFAVIIKAKKITLYCYYIAFFFSNIFSVIDKIMTYLLTVMNCLLYRAK